MAQQQEQMDSEMHLIRIDGGSSSESGAELSGEEWGKRVLITNTVGDAVQGLYELIHNVFAPKLLGSVARSARCRATRALNSAALTVSRFVFVFCVSTHFTL